MRIEIAGGTYLETCLFPEWKELYGSGLRAASAIRALGGDVGFHTYVSDADLPTLRARAIDGNFDVHQYKTETTVRFDYVHGFSTPVILPPPHLLSKASTISLAGDAILRFGFMEGDAVVHGGRVVYDPQSPHRPETFGGNGSTAEELAFVCNRTEGRLLTGAKNPHEIASALLRVEDCTVAVIKCGSHGCIVAGEGLNAHVPAFRTDFVWPIGSGDVFAAVFSKLWAIDKLNPAEAAEGASKATAHYCETMSLDFPADFFQTFKKEPVKPREFATSPEVYLAGPFFSMSQNWLIEQAFDALLGQGLKVFSPLHHVGRGDANEVYGKDIEALERCSIVFACVDGLDSGTIYEIGYAKAHNKPVVAFVQNETEEDLKMLQGSGCFLEKDFVTAIYKTYWMAMA